MERSLGPEHLCSPHGEPAESAWTKEACCWGGIREAGYHTDWRGGPFSLERQGRWQGSIQRLSFVRSHAAGRQSCGERVIVGSGRC